MSQPSSLLGRLGGALIKPPHNRLTSNAGCCNCNANLQAAIEAIDRAIKDEEQRPPDYAQEEPVTASEASVAEGSNVVDVDFDPA